MTHIEQIVDIAAPPESVWAVMADVEHWPEWTPSVRSVELQDGKPFEVGCRARIRQPRLAPAIWAVTEIDSNRYFEWQTVGVGVRTVGGHRIDETPSGSRVTLSIDWSGPIAWLVGLLFGGLTRRYMQVEGQGLKQRCERHEEGVGEGRRVT
ncbi:MAG: SRPBCC family protein [Rhodothermales bacterium]